MDNEPEEPDWFDEIEIEEIEPDGPDPFDAIEETYSDECLNSLAEKYGFNAEATNFKWWLHSGAKRYRLYDAHSKANQSSNTTKLRISLEKQLAEIVRFQKAFDLATYPSRKFKPETPNPFLEEVECIALRAMKHQDAFTLEGELFKLTSCHRQLADAVAMERHGIEEHLDELKSYKGGRPVNEAAFEFVAYLSDFWTRNLDRPLTIDAHKGQGLTEAFAFVRDCAKPLIPLTDSQITTMIRKFRIEK